MEKIYGIDLGTTNSCIAVHENDYTTVLNNIEGNPTTPSVVYFTEDDEAITGETAKNEAAIFPDSVVSRIKRNMGKHGPQYNHITPSGKEYTPEMISSIILRKLCKDAEEIVGAGSIKNVVVTVPAYFGDEQRTATEHAIKLAGLNKVYLLNEPTAAAIAFGVSNNENGRVIVYDLGGGTFDVTLMEIDNGNFKVIATDGDSNLGGTNFDAKLKAVIMDKLREQGCEAVDDDDDDAFAVELLEGAESAKKKLTTVENTKIRFTKDGKNYTVSLSRDEFEEVTSGLLDRTRFILENVIEENGLTFDEIDHIIAVGGSTKMPMVKKMLSAVTNREILNRVDLDTAVAIGAAIFASTLNIDDYVDNGGSSSSNNNGNITSSPIKVSDVTSKSLGVITFDGLTNHEINSIIIPHNTTIPTKMSQTFYTVVDNQEIVDVRVTEGDEEDVRYVKIIGTAQINLPPYPKGAPLDVVFAYDPDQTISIELIDGQTNLSLGMFEIERTSNMNEDELRRATQIMSQTTIE